MLKTILKQHPLATTFQRAHTKLSPTLEHAKSALFGDKENSIQHPFGLLQQFYVNQLNFQLQKNLLASLACLTACSSSFASSVKASGGLE